MYIGEIIEAAPMPRPPRMRKTTNCVTFGGKAVADGRDEKQHGGREDQHLLAAQARRSACRPAPRPHAQPTKAQAAAQPFHNCGSRLKCSSRKPMAPGDDRRVVAEQQPAQRRHRRQQVNIGHAAAAGSRSGRSVPCGHARSERSRVHRRSPHGSPGQTSYYGKRPAHGCRLT